MKLFHYTSREAALEHILPTGRLRFGRLTRTNDPREFGPLWFPIVGRGIDQEFWRSRNPFDLIDEANEILRDSVRLLCFTEDRPSPAGQPRYGNGPVRARMWAQYSEDHTGVCLCFDGERLISAAESQIGAVPGKRNLRHGQVTYAPEGEYPRVPALRHPEVDEHPRAFIESILDHRSELFFTKDWDWSSETEYRLLLWGQTKDEESIAAADALEAVIAGPRFHAVYRPGLYKLCQELRIEPLEIQWQMGDPVVVEMLDPSDRPLADQRGDP